ncbi:MAG: 50S ribosomal protein L29 [Candidatus Aenigmatarchaeota archaeon]|nr:50S ribosomal protein L29 [Candidatus Aenigmarchaeota archaeon]
MAILKIKDIRNMKTEELLEKLKNYKEELRKLKMQTEMKRPIKNTSRIRELRKTIARILTVLRERNIKIK